VDLPIINEKLLKLARMGLNPLAEMTRYSDSAASCIKPTESECQSGAKKKRQQ
jgi:hypothetical protein